jgi:hypothetical protein
MGGLGRSRLSPVLSRYFFVDEPLGDGTLSCGNGWRIAFKSLEEPCVEASDGLL